MGGASAIATARPRKPRATGSQQMREKRVIAALLTTPRIDEAAAKAGLERTAVTRTLNRPHVLAELAEKHARQAERISDVVVREVTRSIVVLAGIRDDPGASEQARISASAQILRLIDVERLLGLLGERDRRIAELEAELASLRGASGGESVPESA